MHTLAKNTQPDGQKVQHPALQIDSVQIGYGQVVAVWDISLTVHPGEFVAVVGPNGAGKTSLVKAISGLVPLSNGSIQIFGKDIQGMPAHKVAGLGVAQSPEGRKLFPEMTVLENLHLGGYTCNDKAVLQERFEKVFTLFPRLEERQTQLASTLSGGEQQMVALGRALMADPKVLLLDEPSLGLAPKIVDEVFDAIAEIHAKGVTILIVEQNVRQTLEAVDRGYVIENGHLVLDGEGQELLNNEHINKYYLGL